MSLLTILSGLAASRPADLPDRGPAFSGGLFMNNHAWLLLGLFMTALLLLVRPLGIYISRVMMMENHATWSAASKKRCSGRAAFGAMKTWAG
jgi:hypothetical protein